jgi:arabinan endo-1,5-alpha-L-arabinosidase
MNSRMLARTRVDRMRKWKFIAAVVTAGWWQGAEATPLTLTGQTGAHDPSTVLQYGNGDFTYFATGLGIVSRQSTDMIHWTSGPVVFPTAPAWTTTAVPGANDNFWAPEVTYFGGTYRMYYAVSTFGSQVSGIGEATNTTLDPTDPAYKWVDQGPVIESHVGSLYNTIDPSILVDTNGKVWMSFGSFWDGIYETQLDPTTGMLKGSTTTQIATNAQIEASYLYKHDNFYYLFVNFGFCCQGVNSTYNIRVGRSTSATGPFIDESGNSMVAGGGTLLQGTSGKYIGPGQTGILTEGDQDYLSFHYYDGTKNGNATFGMEDLFWTAQDWPTLTAVPEPENLLLTAGGAIVLSSLRRRFPRWE